ncbi:unnamed protein product [Nippostrongylus brasiliensis]|uniref:Transmembrane protein 53 (inferred by orthology to a human protein) n=1 Tax=Nippostrongylus brasiliensis TaxID=27835 RepID=A0A158QXN3_NIPBR|nr:unnamed protein product [Nippostrongylus brasiliensis]
MNGVYTLCSIILQHPELDIVGRTDGIVFDSCPVLFDATSVVNFVNLANTLAAGAMKNAGFLDKIKFLLWKIYFVIGVQFYVIEQFIRSKLRLSLANFTPYHFLKSLPLPAHLSFVYSDSDSICPPRTINDFHNFMKRKGHNVEVLHLADSTHVEHYKKYPAEYLLVVRRFLSSLEQRS